MNDNLARLLGDMQLHYPHHLELEYPNIVTKLAAHWENGSLEAYLDGLLFDDRGNRSGFPPGILSEIFAIQNYYRSLHPSARHPIDQWRETAIFEKKDDKSAAPVETARP